MAGRVVVRAGRREDEGFVVATAERLGAFEVPPWRRGSEIVAGEARTLRHYFEAPDASGAELLVAQSADGERLGFAFLETVTDYFSGSRHGHIGILAVAAAAEGHGAGGALLRAAEEWARARRYARLTLNVFESNRHARAVYEHHGYEPEIVRYVKAIEAKAEGET